MQSCLRDICYLAASSEFEIRVQRLSSEENRLAYMLVRWSLDKSYSQQFLLSANQKSWQKIVVFEDLFSFIFPC